ncbi:hypothetical protein AYK26_05755 [Euryarchaeota archaeon SM23-78]|nr:MAG: hypothetical protein AYK26_05755 [Euryarchaeota archaeon SM23-78]MBW3000986.1 hypothetical protein [Candidatus Woesearchaeota archaeon]
MKEQTLVFIKPDHVKLADKILEELDELGTRLQTVKVDCVPKQVIENHYAIHKGKSFYDYLVGSFVGRPIVLAVYEGEGIVEKIIAVSGATDPAKAEKGTIRTKYSNDSLEIAMAEKRPVKNVIHRADSPESALYEMKVWEAYLKPDNPHK